MWRLKLYRITEGLQFRENDDESRSKYIILNNVYSIHYANQTYANLYQQKYTIPHRFLQPDSLFASLWRLANLLLVFAGRWCHHSETIIPSLCRTLYKQWAMIDMHSGQTDNFVVHNTT